MILVFDIETVPDIIAARRLYELDGLSDADTAQAMFALRREKVGHDFLPHHLQRIVAISLVLAQPDGGIKVWSLGDEHSDEPDLIKRFFHGIDHYTPTLVSWNGSGFDLPVLHYRALLHGIQASTYWETGEEKSEFRWNNYLSRFHARHLDLMDVLAGYQNKAFAPLDEIATMLGFPGKMGMHGAQVWSEYLQGNLTGIRNYCETDVLNTYCVYLRFQLMRGTLNQTTYQQHLEKLQQLLTQAPQAHLNAFAQEIIFSS
jgi:predicted PolB exonuclease-like 3'-5' exonuclease